MRFSQEFIENVKNANDIVDVANNYISLKRKGRTYFGLCPFHREKTPSFAVSQDKQIYHCFGCGEGGTVIQFVQQVENLDFTESIEFLAERAHIQLPVSNINFDDKKERLRDECYKINEVVADVFYKNIFKPESKIAQDYVKQRKMTKETLVDFKIGVSTPNLYKFLKEKGFSEEAILETAVVYKKDGKYIDRFINRLMFPIMDVKGRVIGFTGRTLGDDGAKYINSNENLVYKKGRNLFGLNIAKKHSQENIIVVEGSMDAISLHQRGIKNVVAPLRNSYDRSTSKAINEIFKRYNTSI